MDRHERLKAVRRRKAIIKRWKSGNLGYKLRPEQKTLRAKIYDALVQLIVFNISRRWGKTYVLCLYAIEQAIQKKQKIRYGAAFRDDLEEFVIPSFEQILEDCPDSLKPRYIRSRKTWVFPNGSEIKLVGLDKNPNGLRGNAINIIIIDEAGFVARLKYIYQSVIIPATAKQENIKIIISSTPPESPEHFYVQLMTKAQLQENGAYFELTIDEISDLDPNERKRLLDEVGGEKSVTAQREFFCKIIIDADRAIAPNFDQSIHVMDFELSDEYFEEQIAWRIFGDAGGVRDLTAFLRMGYHREWAKILVQSELWFYAKTATGIIVEGYKETYKSDESLIMDQPGQLQIDYSSLGLPAALPAKDNFDASILLIDNSFYKNEVIIHPRCKLLIQTLKNHLLNPKRTDFERLEATGHADAAMAYCYGLRGVDKITDLRPRPPQSQVFIPPRFRKSNHENHLANLRWGK